jgi:hypothetical protein
MQFEKKKSLYLLPMDHNTLWSQGYITDITMGGKQMPKALLFKRSSGGGSVEQLSRNNKILPFAFCNVFLLFR